MKYCYILTLLVWLSRCVFVYGETNEVPYHLAEKRFQDLAPHPRLYVSSAQLQRMIDGRGEGYADLYEKIESAAQTGLEDTENPMEGISKWSRGVLIQGRLLAQAIQWHRTRDRRYLDAALKTLHAMKDWMLPAQITLAEGQFIAGFAITYDLLYNDLTEQQRTELVELARAYLVKPFMRVTGPKDPEKRPKGHWRAWWLDGLTNWNPVSITGGGLLALTMYEELDESQEMINRVNESYQPILDYLETTEGGWMEGLGYWNWTMHYMSLFGISYERATGAEHEGVRSEGFRETLAFGTYFVPHGEATGFGDNNHGNFSHSLLALAEHVGFKEELVRLQDHHMRMADAAARRKVARSDTSENDSNEKGETAEKQPVNIGYGAPQELLINPERLDDVLKPQKDMVKYYPLQGWGMIADQWPNSKVFAITKGGKLGGAHTHNDLLSWQAVIGVEKMIQECGDGRSSTAAFGARDKDIFERGPHAKNGLFIGGIPPDRVRSGVPEAITTMLQLETGPALRLDATRSFWLGQGNPRYVARLFAVIEDKGLLVLDRVIGRAGNPVEARAYTSKTATFHERDVLLQGEFESARMTFASDQPCVLRRAASLTTLGRQEQLTMIRWQTFEKVKDVVLATFLSVGEGEIDLEVISAEDGIFVEIAGDTWKETLQFTDTLEVLEE
jgi:hypothetical protein